MNPLSATRIGALARTLELTPRELLVVALQLAADESADGDGKQRLALAQVRAAPQASEAIAALLLTPIASFAQDDIDGALAQLWPATPRAEG